MDRLGIKKKHLEDMMHWASGRQAESLKEKYGPKPKAVEILDEQAPQNEAMADEMLAENAEAMDGLEGLDEDALRKLIGE